MCCLKREVIELYLEMYLTYFRNSQFYSFFIFALSPFSFSIYRDVFYSVDPAMEIMCSLSQRSLFTLYYISMAMLHYVSITYLWMVILKIYLKHIKCFNFNFTFCTLLWCVFMLLSSFILFTGFRAGHIYPDQTWPWLQSLLHSHRRGGYQYPQPRIQGVLEDSGRADQLPRWHFVHSVMNYFTWNLTHSSKPLLCFFAFWNVKAAVKTGFCV